MFDQILKQIKNKRTIYVFPNITKKDYQFITKKWNPEELELLRIKLNKYTDIKYEQITQKETFYKDLVNVTICSDNYCSNSYIKKLINNIIVDDNLIVITDIILLDETQYPNLTKYDHTCLKTIDIYSIENIKVKCIHCNLINENDMNNCSTVCLDVSNVTKENVKIFHELVSLLYSIFSV